MKIKKKYRQEIKLLRQLLKATKDPARIVLIQAWLKQTLILERNN